MKQGRVLHEAQESSTHILKRVCTTWQASPRWSRSERLLKVTPEHLHVLGADGVGGVNEHLSVRKVFVSIKVQVEQPFHEVVTALTLAQIMIERDGVNLLRVRNDVSELLRRSHHRPDVLLGDTDVIQINLHRLVNALAKTCAHSPSKLETCFVGVTVLSSPASPCEAWRRAEAIPEHSTAFRPGRGWCSELFT